MKELGVFNQLAQLAYLPIYHKLLSGAIELDVFSRLKDPITAEALAAAEGWDPANTAYLLGALCSVGFLKQENGRYVNTAETGRYLSADSSEYAGGFLMTYIQEGMMPVDIVKLVKHGSDPANMVQMNQSLDFTQYGDAFRAAQRGCRQQEILRIVRSLPENRQIKTVLDIGCNTGLLGLAVIADEDGRTGVLFDMPPLVPLILESARQMGLSEHVEARGGNFLTDDLGKDYDLILAVSIMLFAKQDMRAFLKKLCDALAPGGVVICVGEGIRPDLSAPWDMVMGYLPYMLQGMDMPVKQGEIEAKKTARKAVRTAKEAAEEVAQSDPVVATEIEVKKNTRKAGRKAKETVSTTKEVTKEAAGIPNIIIQSPMGGYITPTDIAKKVPKGTADVYVRVDENKLYYVLKNGETGDMDIWK